MLTVNLNKLELQEHWGRNQADMRCRATFPLLGAMGTENTAMVYFELEPGDQLGRHTDSAEEVLLILQGSVEVSVGQEQGQIAQGELALVPTMVPHNLRNIGQETAKVLGFFGSPNIVATFDAVFGSTNGNVIDTAAMTGQAA